MSAVRKKKVAKLNTDYSHKQEQIKQNTDRKRIGLIRRLTVFGVLALIIGGLMVSALITQTSAIENKKAEKVKLEQQLTKLQSKQKQLKGEVVKLNDDDYIKKIARRDYFLSEDGEIIFNVKKD
ncbi:septum formation initiator family protein [Priestia sp. Y58]|uniref:FtsB family cell division protein n=1 Tax=Priestia TaxID=2800373 RepID=UPI001C8D95A2|nr:MULTISPECIES: septum formation initiator family protein [Priestia]MBX9985583.1 septum formation initiator family protein [Priestia aryabhattai]MBY0002734.1 septum formation initiator family protein [Priestia aryabhattai]MCZ8497280.1 septum formation initiator family protein [Priestia megaterium]MDG0033102.1 septum formation initiator family protein [Priestia sp. Y58]MDG0062229.1 septum formation initiator family protein [Priestia sp. P5]